MDEITSPDCPKASDPRATHRTHAWRTVATLTLGVTSTVTRRCALCGKLAEHVVTKTTDEIDAERTSEAGTLNENALHALPLEYPTVRFPETMKERSVWRVTRRANGHLNGLAHLGALTILATDGVTAWFARERDLPPFHGHVAAFDGEVKPLFSAGGGKTTTKPSESKRMARAIGRKALLATI